MKVFTPKKHYLLFLLLFAGQAPGVEFPESRRSENEPFPRPLDNTVVEVNPPAFVWLPVEKSTYYHIHIFSESTSKPILSRRVSDNILVLESPLAAGDFEWDVEAFDKENESIAKRRMYRFFIQENTPEFPYPDIQELRSNINLHHPRLIFDKYRLEKIKSSINTTRRDGWAAVKHMADESLNLDVPEPPWYGEIEEYNTRRLEYRRYYRYLRPYIDHGLQSLALAWLMTGDRKYADKAKKILMTVIEWTPNGITSSNEIGFDEPGLSLARCMHRVYDWLYETLNEEERMRVRNNVIARARDTWKRVGENRPFIRRPGSSHDGRLIGYLGEQALVLAGEVADEEINKWLDLSLKSFWTVFPHWAGCDGGWAEGIGYAAAYNIRATTWIESFVSTVNLDMWQKPFFQKIRHYFLYCARPNDEFWAFGDGAERGPRLNPSRARILRGLMDHYGQRFDDPASQWWADQVPLPAWDISNPVNALILGKETMGEPPAGLPQAALFRDVGWAALHSDLTDLDEDVFFLFKSSPYGSVSHSHADQNSFYLSVGGRALAIPSGYYGPVYGMPHHAEWTRSSKANNTILINGQGQVVRDYQATGEIKKFVNTETMTYLCGDAAESYRGALTKFDRQILYLHPGVFVILDDLEAAKASSYQWMLHAMQKMKIETEKQDILIERDGAKARFSLFNSTGEAFAITQTDQFDTPFNAGADSSYHSEVMNQWHLTAGTPTRRTQMRIAAFVSAGRTPVPFSFSDKKGWKLAEFLTSEGTGQLWAKLRPDSEMPNELLGLFTTPSEAVNLIGIWKTNSGEIQILSDNGV